MKRAALVLLAHLVCCSCASYFADWSKLTGERDPVCVDIPANLSLCHKIGYKKMRLPNLLDHDTLHEVSQQANSWVPLLNVNCHPDTQLFLCSLFAPVCLDRPIYPCRSLCQKVKAGCAGTMANYGYPWPPILHCSKFPVDNDMCITSQSDKAEEVEEAGPAPGKQQQQQLEQQQPKRQRGEADENHGECRARACNQPGTYENIMDNYCQADFVIKVKFRRLSPSQLHGRKVSTVFKTWRGTPAEMRKLRKPRLKLGPDSACCSQWLKERTAGHSQRYLVMGKKQADGGKTQLMATYILPWSKGKDMKRARRSFKQIDCHNLPQASEWIMAEAFKAPSEHQRSLGPSSRRNGRRSGSGENHRRRRRHRHGETRASGTKKKSKSSASSSGSPDSGGDGGAGKVWQF